MTLAWVGERRSSSSAGIWSSRSSTMISSGGEIGNEKVAIVVALGVYLSARCVRQRRGRGLAGLCYNYGVVAV